MASLVTTTVNGTLTGNSSATFDSTIRTKTQLRVSADYSVNYFYKTDNTTMLGYLLMRDDNKSYLSFPAAQDFRILHGNDNRIAVKTDGKVGIGTTAPAVELDVYGSLNLRSEYNLTWGGTAGADIPLIYGKSGSSGYLAFHSQGTDGESMRIDAAGSVGIGTNAPANSAKLDVRGRISVREDSELQFGTHADYAFMEAWDTSADRAPKKPIAINPWGGNVGIGTTAPANKFHINDGTNINLGIAAASTAIKLNALNDAISANIPMEFGASVFGFVGGNVGIGETAPEGLLSFKADESDTPKIRFQNQHSDDADAAISTYDDTSGTTVLIGSNLYINSSGSTTRFNTGEESAGFRADRGGLLQFYTGETGATATERIRVTADGKVGIGTTPVYKLEVVTGASSAVFEYATHATGTQTIKFEPSSTKAGGTSKIYSSYAGTGATEGKLALGTYSAQTAVVMTSTGNVGIGTTTPSEKLHVDGAGYFEGGGVRDGGWHRGLEITTENNSYASLYFGGQSTTKYSGIIWTSTTSGNTVSARGAQIYTINTSATNSDIRFDTNNAVGSSSPTTKMAIQGDGNVGIGTNSPANALHIHTDSASDKTIFLDNTGSGQTGLTLRTDRNSDGNAANFIHFDAADDGGNNTRYATIESFIVDNSDGTEDGALRFSVMAGGNDVESMTIAAKSGTSDIGWVGIGTTSPDTLLHIYDATSTPVVRIQGNTGGNSEAQLHLEGYKTGATAGAVGSIIFENHNASEKLGKISVIKNSTSVHDVGDMAFYTHATGGTGDPVERMRINSDGEVGIGTNDPTQQLMVWEGSSSVSLGEYSNGAVIWLDGVNGDLSGGDYFNIWADGNTALRFGYGATQKVSMLSGGSVGIGTTTPSAALDVVVSSTVWAAEINQTNASNGDGLFVNTGSTASADYVVSFRADNANIFDVKANGNVGIGTATPGHKLEVYGSVNGTYLTELKNTHPTNGYGLVVTAGDDADVKIVEFRNLAETSHFTMLGDGKVGIGTNDPKANCHIHYANTSTDLTAGFLSGVAGNGLRVLNTSSTVNSYGNVDFRVSDADARIAAVYTASNSMDFHFITEGNSTATKMLLQNSGKLLINVDNATLATTSYRKDLQLDMNNSDTDVVEGNALAGGGTGGGALIHNRNTTNATYANLDFRAYDGDGRIAVKRTAANTADFYFILDNGGTLGSKMVIKADGKVGIGTTDPTVQLEVSGTNPAIDLSQSGTNIFRTELDGANDVYQTVYGAGNQWILRTNGGTAALTINASQNATFAGTMACTTAYTTQVQINTGSPILVMKDTDSTGSAQVGYISFLDSTGTEKGWIGYGSSGNSYLTIKNGHTSSQIVLDAPTTSVTGNFTVNTITSYSGTTTTFNDHLVMGGVSATASNRIYFDDTGGSEWYMEYNTAAGGGMRFVENGSATRVVFTDGGSVGIGTTDPAARLHVDGTVRVGVDDAGHDVMLYGATTSRYWEWDASHDLVRQRDNVKTCFGNGDDLEIYHDGSNSHIKNSGSLYVASETSGDLYLRSDDDIFIQPQGGENGITLTGDGAVSLYYDNSKKFETTSSGVEATLYGFDKGGSSIGGYLELTNQAGDASSNDVTVTAAHSTNSVVLRAAQKVEFYTYASSAYQLRMRILNDGKVGIGTTNPTNNLVVYATGHQVNFVTETDDHSGMRVKGAAAKDKYILFNDQCKIGYQHSTATLHLCRSAAFGDNHLVINSSGSVGIGTYNPGQMLSVFQGKIGVTDAYMIGNLDGNTGMLTYSSSRVTWEIGGSEKMRLSSSGNVGIGTTNPEHRLDVHGGGGGTFGAITNRQSANANTDGIATVNYDAGNSSLRLWVDGSGNRKINAGATEIISFTTSAVSITKSTTITGTATATTFSGSGASLTSLNATNLGSGTVPIARLGSSGTASSSTYLRGDNTWAAVSGGSGMTTDQYVKCGMRTSAGANDGGSITADTWTTRDINYTWTNNGSFATVSTGSNWVTLDAGDYYTIFRANAVNNDYGQARLEKDDGTVLVTSNNGNAVSTSDQLSLLGAGYFTLASQDNVLVKQISEATQADYGLGRNMVGIGATHYSHNVYFTLEIWKIG